MTEQCFQVLRRVLQFFEQFHDITSIPDDLLDHLMMLLEFVYRELIFLQTVDHHYLTDSITESICSVGRCLRTINLVMEYKLMSSGHFNVHICHSDLVGRPRFEISPQQLLFLVESQFTVTQMADILGVSTRTVRRRMEEYDISITTQYSRMTDLELDIIVGEIQAQFPTSGNRQMQGHLLSMGYRIPQQSSRVTEKS